MDYYSLWQNVAIVCYIFSKGMRAMVNLHCIDTFLLGPNAPSLKMLLFFVLFLFLFFCRVELLIDSRPHVTHSNFFEFIDFFSRTV